MDLLQHFSLAAPLPGNLPARPTPEESQAAIYMWHKVSSTNYRIGVNCHITLPVQLDQCTCANSVWYSAYYLLSQLHFDQALISNVWSITCLVTVHMSFSAPFMKHVMHCVITISHRTVKLLHIHHIDWLLNTSTLYVHILC